MNKIFYDVFIDDKAVNHINDLEEVLKWFLSVVWLFMFKELFEKLCCKHDWKFIKEVKYYDDNDRGELPSYCKILYCCKKCGKFKQVRIWKLNY